MSFTAPSPESTGVLRHGLKAGQAAPDFSLPSTKAGHRVQLRDGSGRPTLLVFYPLDFTPVCSSELGLFNELLPQLSGLGARLFGISVDAVPTHLAFAADHRLRLPLLSDFEPKGEVARRYHVYRDGPGEGFAERALFVIDGGGTIFWSTVSPIELGPGAADALDALERLTGRAADFGAPLQRREARP